ncbi:23S rRNA (guanosine(2251)-2'-O)-methyltransferase RlmB [Candidatus Oleimmundimicrobium sp.]|uniref:23S rRNA (guanosine(2251)-2'-O)-methyltransferase RlmB n=1 Tax=Candidatus Oleimmundimicrobium sp. TaxID=3060597 RepID=UPI00280A9750|nr:23S rRNA (guanosine(2251)-2'-O)-methyltransferase RlmB [Candidatus Oleimmundimicrobium sp.]
MAKVKYWRCLLVDIIEGRNPVFELLRGGRRVKKIFIAKGIKENEVIKKIKVLAKRKGVPIEVVLKEKIESHSHIETHQGIIAYAEDFEYQPLVDFLAKVNKTSEAMVLILDEVTDPQNFGSLIRSAEACGVDGIIISKKRSVGITPVVCKISAGAIEHVSIIQVSNLVQAVERLKENGFWIFGADASAEKKYYDADLAGKLCIVLGGEDKGIARLLLEKCDFLIKIPMFGKVNSLNVAVAGAILMCEARRQRIRG